MKKTYSFNLFDFKYKKPCLLSLIEVKWSSLAIQDFKTWLELHCGPLSEEQLEYSSQGRYLRFTAEGMCKLYRNIPPDRSDERMFLTVTMIKNPERVVVDKIKREIGL